MIDATVTGSSLSALAAALDLAELGLRVRVVDTGDADQARDLAAADGDGVLQDFLDHVAAPLGEGEDPDEQASPLRVPPAPVWLPDVRGGWTRQPLPAVSGVPAVPLSHEALAILGGGAAFRAYLDRLKPLLTIGKTRRLGTLVDKRLGPRVRERLVEPFAVERFGVGAADVDAAVAAPGLNEAMSRAGALTGGVLAESERTVARETAVVPGGGWSALDAALRRKLRAFAVEFVDAGVASIERTEAGWRVHDVAGGSFETRALVLDAGRRVDAAWPDTDAETAEELDEITAAARTRVRARLRVTPPEAVPEHAGPLLQRVTVAGQGSAPSSVRNEVWSVRLELRETGHWVAELAGPSEEPGREQPPLPSAILAELLEAAGVSEAPGAEWDVLRVAAETPTLDERTRLRNAVSAFESRHAGSLLVVGRRVHGDSLAEAVRAAREGSVPLRRHLTGIAE